MYEEKVDIDLKFDLKINSMTITEFQKEIEKLSHLLDEMKQLSMFQDEEDDLASGKNNGVCLDNMPYVKAPVIKGESYWLIRNAEISIEKVEGTD